MGNTTNGCGWVSFDHKPSTTVVSLNFNNYLKCSKHGALNAQIVKTDQICPNQTGSYDTAEHLFYNEKFEDINEVIRSCKSKKDRH
jgi:hypothetical protein